MHNSSLCFTSSSYLRKGTPKNGSGPHSPGMRALFCLLSSFKFNSLESGGKARTGGHLILSGWRLFHQDLWMHHIRRPEPVRDGVSLSLSPLSPLSPLPLFLQLVNIGRSIFIGRPLFFQRVRTPWALIILTHTYTKRKTPFMCLHSLHK